MELVPSLSQVRTSAHHQKVWSYGLRLVFGCEAPSVSDDAASLAFVLAEALVPAFV